MSFLTPQEKKRLSYAHDRRNTYGENAKSSRKAIPKRKQQGRQATRRVANQILPAALAAKDLLADDSVENRIAASHGKKQEWRKSPDTPLKKVVQRKLERHARLEGKKKEPNKAPEPTPGAVTPRATEGISK